MPKLTLEAKNNLISKLEKEINMLKYVYLIRGNKIFSFFLLHISFPLCVILYHQNLTLHLDAKSHISNISNMPYLDLSQLPISQSYQITNLYHRPQVMHLPHEVHHTNPVSKTFVIPQRSPACLCGFCNSTPVYHSI